MKRISLFLMATLFVLGMTQCKKENNSNNVNEGEKVHITLKVNRGAKASVTPGSQSAPVEFADDDIIYVAYNGVYVGQMTYNSNTNLFSGNITAEADGSNHLYFYFLGNQTPHATLTEGTSDNVVVDIYDQTGVIVEDDDIKNLPVISCAGANEVYSGPGSYTAELLNQCALVKFSVTKASGFTGNTYITGLNNIVKIVFASDGVGTITHSQMGAGAINVGTRSGDEVWVIMLPQTITQAPVAYSDDWVYYGSVSMNSNTITENDYLSTASTVSVTMDNGKCLPGKFTTQGHTIRYAAGNLQYLGNGDGTGTWRIADNQYDFFGDGTNGTATADGYSSTQYNTASGAVDPTTEDKQAARDLFGWGTSGWDNTENDPYAICFQPYSTHKGNAFSSGTDGYNQNRYGYGPSVDKVTLTGSYANYDWGVYHRQNGASSEKIVNGGSNEWRTTSHPENQGIVARANNVARLNVTKFSIDLGNGKTACGQALLPDGWSEDNYETSCPYCGDWRNLTIALSQFKKLEANGVVFLPAAGVIASTSVGSVNTQGWYFSCQSYSRLIAYRQRITAAIYTASLNDQGDRYRKMSVRLVCNTD